MFIESEIFHWHHMPPLKNAIVIGACYFLIVRDNNIIYLVLFRIYCYCYSECFWWLFRWLVGWLVFVPFALLFEFHFGLLKVQYVILSFISVSTIWILNNTQTQFNILDDETIYIVNTIHALEVMEIANEGRQKPTKKKNEIISWNSFRIRVFFLLEEMM